MAITNPAILQLLADMKNNKWRNDITRLNEENMNAINNAFVTIIENGLNVLSEEDKTLREAITELQENAILESDTFIIDGMSVPIEVLNSDNTDPSDVWNGEYDGWTFGGN